MQTAYKWTYDMENMTYGEAVPTLYWISPNGYNATGDGTNLLPWKTLSYACSQVTNIGAVIHVAPGTYTETAQSVLAVGVSIMGAGVTSIITSAAALAPLILMSSASEGTNGNQSISYIQMDGNLTVQSPISIVARSSVEIHHCTFVDFLHYGTQFRGRISGDGAPSTYATGNSFHDNTVTNCAIYDTQGHGNLEIGGQSGMLIYNNIITVSDRGTGVHAYGIKGVLNNGYLHGLKIYDNTITVPPYEGAGFEFAIELWSQRGGIEIYNNTISGGVDIGGYDSNDAGGYGFAAKIYDNDIGRVALVADHGRGVIIESGGTSGFSGGVYVFRNYFHNISNPIEIGVGNYASMVYDKIHIYYNIFNEIRKSGAGYTGQVVSFTKVSPVATFNDMRFLNNVIYNSSSGTLAASFWCGSTGHTFTNTIIRNNIFVNAYSTVKFESCTVTTINVDNNDWYNCNNTIVYDAGCTVTGNTANNNITTDPAFVTAGSNFHLQAGSGCINTGLYVGLTTDYAGAPVANPPEIGTYEY